MMALIKATKESEIQLLSGYSKAASYLPIGS